MTNLPKTDETRLYRQLSSLDSSQIPDRQLRSIGAERSEESCRAAFTEALNS